MDQITLVDNQARIAALMDLLGTDHQVRLHCLLISIEMLSHFESLSECYWFAFDSFIKICRWDFDQMVYDAQVSPMDPWLLDWIAIRQVEGFTPWSSKAIGYALLAQLAQSSMREQFYQYALCALEREIIGTRRSRVFPYLGEIKQLSYRETLYPQMVQAALAPFVAWEDVVKAVNMVVVVEQEMIWSGVPTPARQLWRVKDGTLLRQRPGGGRGWRSVVVQQVPLEVLIVACNQWEMRQEVMDWYHQKSREWDARRELREMEGREK